MKRLISAIGLTFVFIITTSLSGLSQEKTEITWKDRLFFGGSLGLQIGTLTIIEVSPQVGYRLTSRLAVGLGIKYEFYKDSRFSPPIKTNIYGGSIFASYVLWKNFLSEGSSIMAHIEDEALSMENKYFKVGNADGRFVLNSFLAGGGLRQRMGKRSYANIMILWNLNQTNLSPYQNPIFRISFQF